MQVVNNTGFMQDVFRLPYLVAWYAAVSLGVVWRSVVHCTTPQNDPLQRGLSYKCLLAHAYGQPAQAPARTAVASDDHKQHRHTASCQKFNL